ncbi:8617_t:CDS:2 [Funneliformis geosporum]|uniref:8617_t:CDS:1 n=1 Tax=Funneliformis geosporum TaxID=1117311 RepID=A0A9W4SAW8_9GLOM|nr:8617_t:CDS:2 [Funneliformis geosporum]
MKVIGILAVTLTALVTLSSSQSPEVQSKNADLAEELQNKFDSLTKDSECEEDNVACIGGDFAKCHKVIENGNLVNKFSIQPCGGGLKCFVLPLVLKPGTSVTCTNEEDRNRRLDVARGKFSATGKSDPFVPPPPPNACNEGVGKAELRKINADNAEALTAKFSTFTPAQACQVNEIACIGDVFAKCATVLKDGKFVNEFQLQACGGGLICIVAPLVNKCGTSITCSTEEDRISRLDQARKNL